MEMWRYRCSDKFVPPSNPSWIYDELLLGPTEQGHVVDLMSKHVPVTDSATPHQRCKWYISGITGTCAYRIYMYTVSNEIHSCSYNLLLLCVICTSITRHKMMTRNADTGKHGGIRQACPCYQFTYFFLRSCKQHIFGIKYLTSMRSLIIMLNIPYTISDIYARRALVRQATQGLLAESMSR